MITYAERVCFRPLHLQLLARVEVLVARVSDGWGDELRCHELARAVQIVMEHPGVVVVDGKCGPVEHSWLVCDDAVILDPYAPGRMPAVQIVDPLAANYRPGAPRDDVRRGIVDRLVREMRANTPSPTPAISPLVPTASSRDHDHRGPVT